MIESVRDLLQGPRPAPGPRRSRPAEASRGLLDVFTGTVARFPDRPAIDAPDETLSYEQLQEAAECLADRLSAIGVGPGDRVGINLTSGTAELYVAILGVLHAGAAYVPVDADDPPARAAAIWQRSGAAVVVQDGLSIHALAPAGGAGRRLTPEHDAWVMFTSGSTGPPKAVAVSHRSAAAFVDGEAALWQVSPDDRVLAGLSVGFDASCEEMWLAWSHGAALVPAPRALVRAASEFGPWLAAQGVTVVSTVPTLAAMWSPGDLAGVRLLILGGEACPDALAWRLASSREVWNTYGPTEATVVTTAVRLLPGVPVTIGWPLRGWEVAVVDDQGRPVPLGQPGELAVWGVGLARYLDPVLDAERFRALPALKASRAYRTGDMVCETIDGLRFIGRRDDQVKLGGRRLELGEIDSQLSQAPGVRAAAATIQTAAAGNPVLVGYVVGDIDPAQVRAALSERLPHGIVPLIVELDALPMLSAGKVDRRALPWPPPSPPDAEPAGPPDGELSPTAAWLAERWSDQLGPLRIGAASDFFELGGSSLAAAKLISVLRGRYPSVAVADIYAHRRLRQLADFLDHLQAGREEAPVAPDTVTRRWNFLQGAGVLALLATAAPQWLIGILAFSRLAGLRTGPQLGWSWLIGGWVVFGSAPGRAALIVVARRLLLPRLRPGRYRRHGWLTWRMWFLERLADGMRSESLAGTPFAARYARLCGHRVGTGARLGTLPPVTSLLTIGAHATLESDVDAHGWWLEGDELVVGDLRIGRGARVGTRTLLAPGSVIEAGAEVEPGSVIAGRVPAGERWSGSPACRVGAAGESWPATAAPLPRARRFWRGMYIGAMAVQALLPLLAALPGLMILHLTGVADTNRGIVLALIQEAPLLAATFLITYALLVAGLVRLVGEWVQPGYHPDEGGVGWALWFSEALMGGARGVLFSLYSSIYIRPWLRLAGIAVGPHAELSTVVGANRLTTFADTSFAADDVVLAPARARAGWLHIAPIEIGPGTFLGNGAILRGDTKLEGGCLVGVLTHAPRHAPAGTSWFGSPALELPRVPDRPDPARTTRPPRRLIVARGAMELIRILLPATLSVVLAALVLGAVEQIGGSAGLAVMLLCIPVVLLGAGIVAVVLTVLIKWLLMGRYRPGEHPLWSFFVWRDEIVNSVQDQLAGTWLLGAALGTPLLPVYLRAMGAKVGRDVWCDTLTITEFDVVKLGDGCVINRFACVETHLFHDRLMRIGPTELGARSTLGPASAVLPDTVIGAGTRVGGRSVVLRGEELPPGTRWHGAPVVSA